MRNDSEEILFHKFSKKKKKAATKTRRLEQLRRPMLKIPGFGHVTSMTLRAGYRYTAGRLRFTD